MNSGSNEGRKGELTDWLAEQFAVTRIELTVVCGDASFRCYYRFKVNGTSYIGVDAPPDSQNNPLFVAMAAVYKQQKLRVPEVIKADFELGFMCLSDLGDVLLLDNLNQHNVADYYQRALALLPQISKVTKTDLGPLPAYDSAFLQRELQLFNEWFLPQHLGLSLTSAQQRIVTHVFSDLVECAMQQPQVGVHRDFHSRNLMVVADDELAVIDFQDAVVGPITYDPVSLLRDCYVVWPDELVYSQLSQFKALMSERCPQLNSVTEAEFVKWFDWMGMQRHIKVCGIFARLYYRDGKPGYLKDIPTVLDYIINIGSKYSQFTPFITMLNTIIKPALMDKTS